jgi:outer membrane protein OmpA-like peptidoglycan-associated protein
MASRRGSGEDFSHSITDLMTSIAVVFVLLFLFFADAQREKSEETRVTVDELFKELQDEFGKLNMDLSSRSGDPLTLEVELPEVKGESLNFMQGSAELLPHAKELLDRVIPKLVGILCSNKFQDRIDSVVIEGHSSTEGKERRNVELSALRATSVLLYALDATEDERERRCFEAFVAASGRGAWHPKRKDGVAEEELDRRVVFRIRVKSLEQREGLASPTSLGLNTQVLEASVLGAPSGVAKP